MRIRFLTCTFGFAMILYSPTLGQDSADSEEVYQMDGNLTEEFSDTLIYRRRELPDW